MFEDLIKEMERMNGKSVSVPIECDENGYIDKQPGRSGTSFRARHFYVKYVDAFEPGRSGMLFMPDISMLHFGSGLVICCHRSIIGHRNVGQR
jgi:hypothetical protein